MTKVRLTVACHIDDLADARNLATCMGWLNGYSPAEWWDTFNASYRDAQSREWRALSLEVAQDFIANTVISDPIERPAEDTENEINLTGARRAQAKLVFWQPTDPPTPVPQADPVRMIAVAGLSGPDALAQMGLTAPPME